MARSALALCVFIALILPGCDNLFKDIFNPGSADAFSIDIPEDIVIDRTAGAGVGMFCTADESIGASDCRFGLNCIDSVCVVLGDTQINEFCILSDECDDGLYCGFSGQCLKSGSGAADASCTSSADCEKGLYCAYLGIAGICATGGQGDIGNTCENAASCRTGLVCDGGGECVAGSPVFGLKPWPGVTCAPAEEGPVRPYFDLPRGGETEFFRLPFPNDARRDASGATLMDGFPTPGPGLIGFDPVARLLDAIASGPQGFGLEPTVYIRFSNQVDFGTLSAEPTDAGAATLLFADITPDSPGYGLRPTYSWFLTTDGGRYICPRYLAASVAPYAPLRPGTSYALVLTRGVKGADGAPLTASPDFVAMLANTAPTDAVEAAAWARYAPLRAWVADRDDLSAADLVGGTVFTTQEPDFELAAVRAAVHAGPTATTSDWTLCDGKATSPCDDGLEGDAHTRGCPQAAVGSHELHFRMTLPVMQEGTRPYLQPSDGGHLARVEGLPSAAATESVCMSLTLPSTGEMPADGWPIAIYGHGTNGTFRTAVENLGKDLVAVDLGGDAGPVSMATLGWDGPMHGSRRGAELPPGELFFNFGNPAASRGNLYQGAADIFAIVRAVQGLTLSASESPTGNELRFDGSKIAYIGHSQGATVGPLAVPFEPDIGLTVWSGAGAGLIESLLNKTAPVDARGGLAVALHEVTEAGPTTLHPRHPVLALLQGYFDGVDPLNHAAKIVRRPIEGALPRHALHVFGLVDHYTPPETGHLFARRLGVAQVAPVVEAVAGQAPVEPPLQLNESVGGVAVTAAIIQASADGYDGHFVMFKDTPTRNRVLRFLATWVKDGVPVVADGP